MSVTCFFCQNLLSDFIEGILPSARYEELRQHLQTCPECTRIHVDLGESMKLLSQIPKRELNHELVLRMTEAATHKRAILTPRFVSRLALFIAIPVLTAGAFSFFFPQQIPLLEWMKPNPQQEQFARYFPLMQGATDIIEEQANWMNSKESFGASVWEEGGLSPEEFEKAFQGRGTPPKKEESLIE